MNQKLRLRSFVFFFSLVFVLLVLTVTFANARTAYSAMQPAMASQPSLDRAAAANAHNVELVGQIGGMIGAVAVQGNFAYVGEGPRLTILDITNPALPGVVGKTAPLPDIMWDLTVAGNYAYIADDYAGLRIIDVADPAAPSEIGFYDTPGRATNVAVVGDYAYVTDFDQGLRIIDISNPATPAEVGFYDTPGQARDVAVSGNFAYVADDEAGLRIIDVSNPATPAESGFFVKSSYALGVTVIGNYAYVAYGGSGLLIIDVTNKTAPIESGFYDTYNARRVAVAGNYAYVADDDFGLRIIDVSIPTAPNEVASSDTSGYAADVAVAGDHAYIADAYDGLRIVDVGNPVAPVEAGFYTTPGDANNVSEVIVTGKYAYVASRGYDEIFDGVVGGLRIINIANPSVPTATGGYDLPFLRHLAVADNNAYVTGGYMESWLRIVDVFNPISPTWRGGISISGDVGQLAVDGNYAYVADGILGLRIIDISNPATPTEVGFYDTLGEAWDVTVAGNYAFITEWAGGNGGLRIVDVSNPAAPAEAGFHDTPGPALDVVVSGYYAYVADGEFGLRIIDISNPAAPAEVGFHETPAWTLDVDANGDFAYVANYNGLRVIDVSNPAAPTEVGFFDTPGSAYSVDVAGNYAYVADSYGGLVILRYTGNVEPDTGSITIRKLADPSDSTKFSFDGDPGSFSIGDGESKVFDDLAEDDYDVSENFADDWYLDRVQCDTDDVSRDDEDVTIFLEDGEHVTCTFFNRRLSATAEGFVGHIGGATYALAVQGNYAYVGEGPRLTILDVSNAAAPAVIGKTLPLPEIVQDLALAGNYAYVADGKGRLRIVDISNPASPTVIGFYETPGSASAVTVAGNYAYVADGNSGLNIIDITDPIAPAEAGYYDTPGHAMGVSVTGNFAYVAHLYSGLHIIDISDPEVPTLAGFYDQPGYVAVAGHYAYIAAGNDGLRIIDVTNPAVPAEVSLYGVPGTVRSVAVAGDYAYVAAQGSGLHIIDVANPSAPIETGFSDSPDWANSVVVTGNVAYVADDRKGLRIIDIANPDAPAETGFYDTPGEAAAVAVAGDYAYIADGSNGLRFVDVANPFEPAETPFFDTQGYARDVVVVGDYAFVVVGLGLSIIDVSNLAEPTEIGFYDAPESAVGVAVAGNFAYIAGGNGRLRIIDVTNPAAPVEISFYDTPEFACSVAVAGGFAFVADGNSGLRIIDVTDPYAPAEAGHHDVPGYVQDVAVAGHYAYIAAGNKGLRIIDVTDPAAPAEIGFYNAPGAHGVAVSGDVAYVSYGDRLRIIDISNPQAPAEAGFYITPGSRSDVALAGYYAYIADGIGGLLILRPDGPVMDVYPAGIDLVGNPGDTLWTSLTVSESGGKAGIQGLGLFASDLTGEAGNLIPGHSISFDPAAFDLSSGGKQTVSIAVPLAGDLPVGMYGGLVTVESLDAGKIPIPILINVEPALGSITIRKETEPSGSTRFSFIGDLGSFSLEGGKGKEFDELLEGNYTISETLKTGWILDHVDCDSLTITQSDDGVIVHLEPGQDVKCTFVNHRLSATADAGGPYTGKEGESIPLDASGTTNQDIVEKYRWDCTADGTYDESSSDPIGSACTYEDNGVYTVKLRTTDIFDEKSTATAQVTVENVAPTVNAGEDQTVVSGIEASFAATFSDPGKADTHTIEWDFGDGNKASGSLTPKHIFANTGQYTVKLAVTDDDGDFGSDELQVDVVNSAPAMSGIIVSPEEIDEGDSFSLTGVMSDTSTISTLNLYIDWGDGQTETKEFPAGSTEFSFEHSCPDDDPSGTTADSYTINLKLTDDEGAFSTAVAAFKVHNVAPTVDAGADKSVRAGEPVTFSAAIADPGISDTHTVTWDFADKSPPHTGVEATHTFNEPGHYIVNVTVQDDDGGIGHDTVNVIVTKFTYVHLPMLVKP